MEKSIVPPSVSNISSTVTLLLQQMPQDKVDAFITDYEKSEKNIIIAYIFMLFLFAHYAYTGKWGLFIVYILTSGGCGLWLLIDLFRLPKIISDYNNELAHNILRTLK